MTKNRAILTFGRFNPPTIGHEALLKAVITAARREDADAVMFLSQTRDLKNPLTYAAKKRIISATFPALTFTPESIRTPYDALTYIKKEGYSTVHLYVGEDRTEDFTHMVAKWHRKEDPDKSVVFVVKSLPRQGKMDPETVSGTTARALARKGDLHAFREILMSGGKSDAESILKKIQTSLGSLTEAVEPDDDDEDDDDEDDDDVEIELGGSEDDDDTDTGQKTPDDENDAPEDAEGEETTDPDGDGDDDSTDEGDIDNDGGDPVSSAMNSFFQMGHEDAPPDPRLMPEDEPTPDIVADVTSPDDSETSYLVIHPPVNMVTRMRDRAEFELDLDLDQDGEVGKDDDKDGEQDADEDEDDAAGVDEDADTDPDDPDADDEDDDEDDDDEDEEMELDLDDEDESASDDDDDDDAVDEDDDDGEDDDKKSRLNTK